ncbi:MAG TPA: histidine--tRNA ligase [Gemmatimonadales bacterium]|nr:histidine--tRNA ligase [Gemmatimonadales bacterium]
MPARALPGFRDFFPDDITLRNHIFAAWRRVAARYGFEEYDGPPLEPLELYTEKSGPEIVGQLYQFTDKGDRRVALRPEMTPSLARMVAARAGALKKPIRWFSVPQLFRYERQQRGRLREHFQLNMDIIGEPGPLADAEIIAAAIDVQRTLGLGPGDVAVRVSDRRVVRALLVAMGVPEENLGSAFAAMDRMTRSNLAGAQEDLDQSLQGSLGHLEAGAVVQRVRSLALEVRGRAGLEAALGKAGTSPEVSQNLAECLDALEAMGLGEFIEVDPSIVRGLAYYTGIVFELFDKSQALRALCGGGRYDGLLQSLGGVDLPAVGFGMGDVVLGEILKDRGLVPQNAGVDAFLVAVTGEDRATVLKLAHDLRDRGIRVEFALKDQTIAKQMKLASARGARVALIVGPEERSGGLVLCRDLATGAEARLTAAEAAENLAQGDTRTQGAGIVGAAEG